MTHIDTDRAAVRPTRKPTAASKPRWRGTEARLARGQSLQPDNCPVAALAVEAAAVLRLKRVLRENGAERDVELVDALEAPEDFVRPSEMKEALFDRLKAIDELASHRRAQSLKGALFQLYLAANHSQNPAGLLTTRLTMTDEHALERNDRRVSRLHHGAISHLEPLALDDDLVEIRRWYFAAIYDVHHTCDRAINGREALIDEVRSLTAHDAKVRNGT